jgi:hypothetical protein
VLVDGWSAVFTAGGTSVFVTAGRISAAAVVVDVPNGALTPTGTPSTAIAASGMTSIFFSACFLIGSTICDKSWNNGSRIVAFSLQQLNGHDQWKLATLSVHLFFAFPLARLDLKRFIVFDKILENTTVIAYEMKK